MQYSYISFRSTKQIFVKKNTTLNTHKCRISHSYASITEYQDHRVLYKARTILKCVIIVCGYIVISPYCSEHKRIIIVSGDDN